MSEHHPATFRGTAIDAVTRGLQLAVPANLYISLGDQQAHTVQEALTTRLVWHDSLNAAVLPVQDVDEQGMNGYRVLATHSTLNNQEVMTPHLRLADRPGEYQTLQGNVYGTGLYVANRPEAAIRRREVEQGRHLGAFLSQVITLPEVTDKRRSAIGDMAHLCMMVIKEKVAPRVIGEQRAAKLMVERQNDRYEHTGTKLVLLNEAPRGRLEKMDYENTWNYAAAPPQYMLLRTPMTRIGTYERPAEKPQKYSVIQMYGKRFWQAAVRNGRDMKRLGAPYKDLT